MPAKGYKKRLGTFEARIGVRLSKEMRQELDELVSQGKFKNLSDLVGVALSKFLFLES